MDIKERLVDFLPEWQRVFTYFPSYIKLCEDFRDFLECKPESFDLCKSKLIHSYSVFSDLCEKDPESLKEKKRIGDENFIMKRNHELTLKFYDHQLRFFKKSLK